MPITETPPAHDLFVKAEALVAAREAAAASLVPERPPTLEEAQADIIRRDAASKIQAMQGNMM